MMLEVYCSESSFVMEIDDKFENALHGKIPFNTSLNVWKEEIYFLTPIEIDVSGLSGQIRVEPGGVYYWPQEKGFCVFYGVSQPYSLVYQLGSYVGVLSDLMEVEDGAEATVKLHRIYEPYSGVVSTLKALGFKASTPMYNGERIVEAVKNIDGERFALKLYVEDNGAHIESEPLFPRDYDPLTLKIIEKLKRIANQGKCSRLDLSEDGWIAITGFVSGKNELQEAINEMSALYCKIMKMLLAD